MANTNAVDYPAEATIGDQWARGSAERSQELIVKSQLARVELHQRISKLAYDFYLRLGKLHGHDLEDWLAAETVVLSQLTGLAKRTGDHENGEET